MMGYCFKGHTFIYEIYPIKAYPCTRSSLHVPTYSNLKLASHLNSGSCSTDLKRNFGSLFILSSISTVLGRHGFHVCRQKRNRSQKFKIYAELEVATAIDVINDLGLDTLTFLTVTVMVVPAFKVIRASPILGFFFAGVVLNQLGLIRNLTDVKVLSEWGILFLLFEMGLELSLARLKALAKFAFGMGLTQEIGFPDENPWLRTSVKQSEE